MGRYLTEAVGTFFLVLVIGFCVTGGVGALTPLAVAMALTVMVYMGGPISGAHFNPAVTVALTMEGAHDTKEAAPYLIAEFAGAILAALLLNTIFGREFMVAPAADATLVPVFVAEMLFAFALVLVILNVAVSPKAEGNSYFGLAIGMTVGAGAFAVGGLSGGAFNPAVGLSTSVVALVTGGEMAAMAWVYLVAPILGGALAVPIYKTQQAA